MNTEFENIVPWNGASDTGLDVRKKMERNFEKIKQNFAELSDFFEKVNIGTVSVPVYAIRAKYDFFSVGAISAYGPSAGSSSPGSGIDETTLWSIMGNTGTQQIAANHLATALSPYMTQTAMSALLTNYAPINHGHVWGDITDRPSSLPASDVYAWAKAITKPSYSYSEITDKPASLPASDVYAWAKAATKPSYDFSEITGKPSTLGGYGITDAAAKSHSHLWADITDRPTKLSQFTNDMISAWALAATKPSYAYSEITGCPTSLPASDVYAWAKAASKPSYSYSEISNTPDLSSLHTHSNKDLLDAINQNLSITGNPIFSKITIGVISLLYDSVNNSLYAQKSDGTSANFYATGGVSSYGAGAVSGGGSGIDETTLWSIMGNTGTQQIATNHLAMALSPYVTQSAMSAALINYAPLVHGHVWGDITDRPASLPASDIYAWAKAASKPSYAFSEITEKPSTLGGYGITDAMTAVNTNNLVTSAISSVQVGGRNLLLNSQDAFISNGDFPAYFTTVNTLVNGFYESVVTSIQSDDTRSYSYGWFGDSIASFPITNQDYMLSFDYKTNSATGIIQLDIRNSDNYGVIAFSTGLLPDTNGIWTRGYFKCNWTITSQTKMLLQVNAGATVNDYVGIRKLKWESGNKATDWSPAPEDKLNAWDNAVSATKLYTARSFTIGNTAKSFDGTGNVSWSLSEIGAAATIHNHIWADITDRPASLPASDVYAWAKAASKPGYAFSEITDKPSTLGGYGITDAASASALANYLPLSGGTITGTVYNSSEVACGFIYQGARYNGLFNHENGNVSLSACGGGLFLGYYNTDAIYCRGSYVNLDSGNYGGYALSLGGGTMTGSIILPYNTSAISFRQGGYADGIGHDTQGVEAMAFMLKNSYSTFKFKTGYDPVTFTANTFVPMANADLEIGNGYGKIAGNTIWHAGNSNNASVDWGCRDLYAAGPNGAIANNNYINNIASSTTGYWARGLLWKNSDLSTLLGGIYMLGTNLSPVWINIAHGDYDSANGICIRSNGNVGIGNISPGYKLHVNGTGYFSDALSLAATLSAAGLITANGNIRTTNYIEIGSTGIRIMYDSTNDCLKLIKSDGSAVNLLVTGGVTALATA